MAHEHNDWLIYAHGYEHGRARPCRVMIECMHIYGLEGRCEVDRSIKWDDWLCERDTLNISNKDEYPELFAGVEPPQYPIAG